MDKSHYHNYIQTIENISCITLLDLYAMRHSISFNENSHIIVHSSRDDIAIYIVYSLFFTMHNYNVSEHTMWTDKERQENPI